MASSFARHAAALAVVASTCPLLAACDADGAKTSARPAPPQASAQDPAPPPAGSPKVAHERHDLVDLLPRCEAFSTGLVLDFGSDSSAWRRGYSLGPFDDAPSSERTGASFARLMSRRTSYDFWLDEPMNQLEITGRVHGLAGKNLTVFVDGHRVGVTKLNRDETRVVTFGPLQAELAAGRHTLVLAFRGAVASGEAFAEIGWIRIGNVGADMSNYAAPTLRDVVANVVLDDIPRRSVVLRAGTSVRCPVPLGPDAEWSVSLGFWGGGKGRAVLSLLRDGEAPIVLQERKVTGGGGATWTTLKIDLGPYASQVVGLELSAPDATGGGRVAFGDPMVQRGGSDPPLSPEARTAVLLVLGGTDRKWVPPWGDATGLPVLADFARSATAFSSYRVPTTVVPATVASALTGLAPRAHTLEHPTNRLPSRVLLLSEILKEAGGRGAMFSGVPSTSKAFGFDSGWDTYDWVSPVEDAPATEPLARAKAWLEKELAQRTQGRRLLVVHLRGAHPPWDLSKEEVRALKPAEYSGPFDDARKSGTTLERFRTSSRHGRLDDADWTRLRALAQAALSKQAESIRDLIGMLKKKDEYADTLFILMGDVAPGDGPEPPFDPAGDLTNDRLLVPLLIRFPGGAFAGQEVTKTVTSVDIARTIADALHVALPEYARGEDLFAAASNFARVVPGALVATLGDRFATRSGPWLLAGQIGRVPRLCRLDVDPACENNVFDTSHIAAIASWQSTFDQLVAQSQTATELFGPKFEPVPAVLDPETSNALVVWGDLR